MAKLQDVLIRHRDISKEVSPALAVGEDSAGILRTLFVDESGELQVLSSEEYANKRLTGEVFLIDPGDEVDVIDYTVPSGMQFRWLSGVASADGDTQWLIEHNGLRMQVQRTSYMERNIQLLLPLRLDPGDTLLVKARNKSFQLNQVSVGAWIYGKEVTI
jgi:hypothetical protein